LKNKKAFVAANCFMSTNNSISNIKTLKAMLDINKIQQLLGKDASLLDFSTPKISQQQIHTPSPDAVDKIYLYSDRNNRVLGNLNWLYNAGNLSQTGYLSILPVDQGVEHSGGASFAKNPMYFDPENIVKLAIAAGCNGVASTLGVLGLVSRQYAHKIPFIVKLNHNQMLSYPNTFDQILFASVNEAYNMGAAGVGATIYFGSAEANRQITEISKAFARAHELGMFTILWCYLRNNGFKKDKDYHSSADLTGQANHLGVTIEADIIKQKLPENNSGYKALNQDGNKFGKYDERIYTELSSDNPIDLARYQLINNYGGKIPLINSGGESGENDIAAAVRTAVINKRAGGSGLILGRKAFQKPFADGVEIIHAVQSVYLSKEITIA
jgi:class I fructose-bisphosphate aldolase